MEIQELKAQLSRMEDPRRTDRGNIRHKLEDIIIIGLSTLRKTALALCKNADFGRRVSIQKKRFIAALNPKKLFAILFADF